MARVRTGTGITAGGDVYAHHRRVAPPPPRGRGAGAAAALTQPVSGPAERSVADERARTHLVELRLTDNRMVRATSGQYR
jgi:hypothetical protein